jgi:predicted nucleic acid-binding protein
LRAAGGALLDTSVVVAATVTIGDLPQTAAISVITLGELYAGVQLARSEPARQQRAHRLAAVRAVFQPIPVDEPIAERYGEVLALARSEGRVVKATDLLIIATAAATTRVLHTLDRAQASLARLARVPVS